MNNPPIVQYCSESTSSQPPLKRFRLLTQDMMERSSAAAITVSNTVDIGHWTDAYSADCQNYSEYSGLKFSVRNANKCPLLTPLAQDLLTAPASEAYVEPWNVYSQSVDSWQQAREIG